MAMKACLLVLAFASAAMANPGYTGSLSEPLYTLQAMIKVDNNDSRVNVENNIAIAFSNQTEYEWEGYDGWFNNPAHPDWGGAGKSAACMRSTLHALCEPAPAGCA